MFHHVELSTFPTRVNSDQPEKLIWSQQMLWDYYHLRIVTNKLTSMSYKCHVIVNMIDTQYVSQ